MRGNTGAIIKNFQTLTKAARLADDGVDSA